MKPFLSDYPEMDLMKASAKYTRHHAKTFYFASFMLSSKKRKAAYVIYSFCRYADDLLDEETASLEEKKKYAAALYAILDSVYSDILEKQSPFRLFQEVVISHKIPKEYWVDLIKGVEMDLTQHRYNTWEELDLYCYRVASVVGLIMSHVFGVSSKEAYPYAISLGKAMQLTNILRDVKEDYDMGRIYLPQEELSSYGVDASEFAHKHVSSKFIPFGKFQIQRARQFYREADKGIGMLNGVSSRFCVRVMSGLYEKILDEIEAKNYDVLSGRVYVSFWKKVLLLVQLCFKSKRA